VKQLPRLWQRKRDGKAFGAWHIYIRNKPINLATDDLEVARERRKQAVRGVRQWPRKMQRKASPAPAVADGAAAANLAAVGETDAPPSNPGEPSSPGAAAFPPSAAAPDMGPPVEVIEPEPIPNAPPDPGNWAADVNDAGAAPATSSEGAAPPRMTFADLAKQFPWLDQMLVTASKACVGVQLKAQAWTMKLVGDVEAGRVGPPPKPAPADGAQSMSDFMASAGARWMEDDPREPGRAAYERTIVALIPEELTLPAWFKWVEAPLTTGINTIPIQWSTGRKIERDAAGNEVRPKPEATADVRAAA